MQRVLGVSVYKGFKSFQYTKGFRGFGIQKF